MQKNYEILKIKCKSCQSINHFIRFCPYVNLNIIKKSVIRGNFNQNRKKEFKRKNKKFSSLQKNKECVEQIYKLRSITFFFNF